MHSVLAWGLDLIRAIQTIQSPALTAVMKGITFAGSESAYLILLPLIYWCHDEKRGLRLSVTMLTAAFVNESLKSVLKQPRPYYPEWDPSVQMASEHTYGLPSGHAQGSLTTWGIIGSWMKKPWGLIAAIAIPLLVAFSRLYLGVHFPTDILGGWLVAGLALLVYFFLGPRIENFLSSVSPRFQILIAALLSFTMNQIHPADVALSSIFFGLCSGYVLMANKFPVSSASGSNIQKLARYILGIAVTIGLYVVLKKVFTLCPPDWMRFFRFLRYGLLGFWVAAGAPWVFLKMGLVSPRES